MTGFLKNSYGIHPNLNRLRTILGNSPPVRCHLKGLSGSSVSMFAAATIYNTSSDHLFILADKEEAAYFFNDLESFCPDRKLYFFPSSFKRPAQTMQDDHAGIVLRTELLVKLPEPEPKIIVTYPEALFEKVISSAGMKKMMLHLNEGESVSRDFIVELLTEYGFTETDFVYEPGEFAIRGSIIDVFSFANDRPCRIDFFGNEVESVRLFDIETQLTQEQIRSVSIIPNLQNVEDENLSEDERYPLISQLDDKTLVWSSALEYVAGRMNELYNQVTTGLMPETGNRFFCSGDELIEGLNRFSLLETGQTAFTDTNEVIGFRTAPQPVFNKNFDLLTENLASNGEKGYSNYIFSENEKQFERLNEIFGEIHGSISFTAVLADMYQGFTDHDLRICCYTDHQIFERYHKFKIRESFRKKQVVSIKTLNELQPGDYVVHIDHGIGLFGGLEKIDVNGKIQETLRLVYKDGDVLYVNIHSLHRISKYKSKDGIPPKIYKLGSGAWQKLKQKTKDKVKDIARELIALYAKRKLESGFSFSADSYLQRELEASFIYEDTPDQLKATNMVKEQMESPQPMDMLVCGDVGFGKTEVAIRAAFKAVCDNKQVAVLVPTTILALQHYNTFSERLRNFPCTVDHISRFRSPAEQKKIIGSLAEGKIDILIGTHRLIGSDVRFRDMGLFIIDEEQKFGVSVKEKLKRIKLNVDTLTLTATPIPRTLQFSLMGARDLAIINTPPPNRHPIITSVSQFNTDIIREAVDYEIQRGGQVFFIHNRIQNIGEIDGILRKVCPNAKTIIAHGQMESSKLEKIMLGFISGEYDVLISTTIIESGLDIPNANTIIVNNAHNFGLSDLHQLRGRVGRSNKKAFCYLLAPPPQTMTREARQRLRAIEDFSELGSGFNIAMQDLDIRGAGNLLGREQSGFIADIGFETYHKILDEAIQELRETEFREVFSKQDHKEDTPLPDDCQVETDLELLIPEEYVPGNTERIKLYRMLDNTRDEESLGRFESGMIDRFGPLPQQTRELLNVVRLRRLAITLGFEKIVIRNGIMVIYFISNQMSPYYQSPLFSGLLRCIQNQRSIKIREQKDKLTMSMQNITSVEVALREMEKLISQVKQILSNAS